MEKLLRHAIDFIKKTGKELYCGEFGVIAHAPAGASRKWVSDLTEILGENHIGYALWNYKYLDYWIWKKNLIAVYWGNKFDVCIIIYPIYPLDKSTRKGRQSRGFLQKESEYQEEMCWSERREAWMARGKEKVRAGFYIEKVVLEMADSLLPAANVRSRNEFVTEAMKFYCGYLNSGKAEDYLLQSLSSVLTSTVQDTKNRLARMDFKIAGELSMLAHMIAYHSESRIDESVFRKLHAKCAEEVRRLNGAVELNDAYKYQKREN